MRYPLILLLAGWGSLGWLAPALAHGAKLEYQPINGIEIQARYDSGDPMSAAQVNIYAPDNPNEPWLTGVTNDDGRFVFTPDASRPGNWEVMVRQAGHGDVLAIPVAGESANLEGAGEAGESGEAGAESASVLYGGARTAEMPRWVSMVAVVWGFIGTALFFARSKR